MAEGRSNPKSKKHYLRLVLIAVGGVVAVGLAVNVWQTRRMMQRQAFENASEQYRIPMFQPARGEPIRGPLKQAQFITDGVLIVYPNWPGGPVSKVGCFCLRKEAHIESWATLNIVKEVKGRLAGGQAQAVLREYIFFFTGPRKAQIEKYRQLARKYPWDPAPYERIAFLSLLERDYKTAEQMYRLAFDRMPKDQKTLWSFYVGRLQYWYQAIMAQADPKFVVDRNGVLYRQALIGQAWVNQNSLKGTARTQYLKVKEIRDAIMPHIRTYQATLNRRVAELEQQEAGRGRTYFFILLGAAALGGLGYWLMQSGKRDVQRALARREGVLVMSPKGEEVRLPAIFDQALIREDLVRYSESPSSLQTYVRGVAVRFNSQQHIKVMRKLIDELKVRTEMADEMYAVLMAQAKLSTVPKEVDLREKELELKRREVELQIQQIGSLKAKELERDIARLEREIGDLRRVPVEPEKSKKRRPSEVSAEFASEVGKTREAEKAIRSAVRDKARADELIADLWEDFRQRWPDYGKAIEEAREDYDED